MLKSDRFSCSQKIRLKQDPPVLPKVKSDWNELAGEVQEKIAKMHFFYCVMHVLVHFAESDNYSIMEAESAHFSGQIPIHDVRHTKKSESGIFKAH